MSGILGNVGVGRGRGGGRAGGKGGVAQKKTFSFSLFVVLMTYLPLGQDGGSQPKVDLILERSLAQM